MPLESRLFVKTGIVALLLSFVWGAVMAFAEASRTDLSLYPVEHAHLAFVGWLVNTVIGFALWMLPLNRERYPATQGRYAAWMPWTIYGLLNGGLVVRLVAEPLAADSTVAAFMLGLSAIAQVAAIIVFLIVAWSRTRPPARPARGVR